MASSKKGVTNVAIILFAQYSPEPSFEIALATKVLARFPAYIIIDEDFDRVHAAMLRMRTLLQTLTK